MPSLELVVVNLERSTGSEFNDVKWSLYYYVSFVVILSYRCMYCIHFCLHVVGGCYWIHMRQKSLMPKMSLDLIS